MLLQGNFVIAVRKKFEMEPSRSEEAAANSGGGDSYSGAGSSHKTIDYHSIFSDVFSNTPGDDPVGLSSVKACLTIDGSSESIPKLDGAGAAEALKAVADLRMLMNPKWTKELARRPLPHEQSKYMAADNFPEKISVKKSSMESADGLFCKYVSCPTVHNGLDAMLKIVKHICVLHARAGIDLFGRDDNRAGWAATMLQIFGMYSVAVLTAASCCNDN